MTRPAIQLYSLRHFDEPLPATLERVASAGYEGVEFATRFPDADAAAVAEALDDTGLEVVSAHVDLSPLESEFAATVDRYEAVGCRDLVVPHLAAAHFRTESRVEAIAARFAAVDRRLDERGIDLHHHNQAHDFLPLTADAPFGRLLTALNPQAADFPASGVRGGARFVGGTIGDRLYERLYQGSDDCVGLEGTALRYFLDATAPEVGVEIDVGGVAAAGFDPLRVVERFEDRLHAVHLKDVAVDDPGPTAAYRSVEAGEGILDVPSVLDAVRETDVEWIVYENDDPSDPETPLRTGIEALEGAGERSPETRA